MLRDSDTAFLISVEPALSGGDLPLVLARLRASWPPERLVELLDSPVAAVVSTAATCLGLTGSMEDCDHLVRQLGHSDEGVASAAEDALWRIWMRGGCQRANPQLRAAIRHVRDGQLEAALRLLDQLIASEESLAEAHHQRAIVLHSLERFEEAEAAYRRALTLNPSHFAAIVGLGHACVQRADYTGALGHYRRALQVHPRLEEIREIVPQLETAIEKRIVA